MICFPQNVAAVRSISLDLLEILWMGKIFYEFTSMYTLTVAIFIEALGRARFSFLVAKSHGSEGIRDS